MLRDALMSEANAENRRIRAKLGDELEADAGFVGSTRAGTDEHAAGLSFADLFRSHGIVAFDDDLGPELA
jgi:hypothetical protein